MSKYNRDELLTCAGIDLSTLVPDSILMGVAGGGVQRVWMNPPSYTLANGARLPLMPDSWMSSMYPCV